MAPSLITWLASLDYQSLLYKDARSDTFWLVIIFIFINYIWVAKNVTAFFQAEKQSKAAAASSSSPGDGDAAPPTNSMPDTASSLQSTWHYRHITTRPRQVIAIVAAAAVVPLQPLAAWWALRIAAINTKVMVLGSLPWTKPYLFAFLVRSPLYVMVVVAFAGTLGFAAFAIVMQVGFVVQVACMDVPHLEETSSEARKKA